jgi:hypothetical protein
MKPYQNNNHNTNQNNNINNNPREGILESTPKVNLRSAPKLQPIVKILSFQPKAFIQTSFKTPDKQYTESRRKEINRLLEKDVFEPTDLKDIPPNTQIFNLQFIDKIKDPRTEKAFKKSQLVIQAYNNANKTTILTKSPTIQHYSQHLLLYLAVYIKDSKLYLYNITQAYTQSTTLLN